MLIGKYLENIFDGHWELEQMSCTSVYYTDKIFFVDSADKNIDQNRISIITVNQFPMWCEYMYNYTVLSN